MSVNVSKSFMRATGRTLKPPYLGNLGVIEWHVWSSYVMAASCRIILTAVKDMVETASCTSS